ncbi:hypothetical protein A9P82_05165 [Arachidicoccus ginsenosidimutans]|nr:hypothetical protein A9P82_05165 [Arachidicoccus sp. BS20]
MLQPVLKKIPALVFTVLASNALNAQTTVFQQDFSNGLLSAAVNGIGGYDATQDPESAISASGITDLKFEESGTNVETIQTNSLTDAANGNCLLVKFDFTLNTVTHGTSSGNSIVFGLGNNPTTRSSISSSKMYAYFGFGTSAVQSKNTQITPVDIANTVTSTTTVDASSAVTIRWYVNNSSSSVSYQAPDGTAHTIAPDNWDLWLDNTQALNGIAANNATGNVITSFKISTGSGYQSSFDVNNLSISTVASASATPITLSSFAVSKNKGALLQWTTASEINSSKFNIEKSTDGKSFTTIATVMAQNKLSGASYSYTDQTYTGGTAYYKLAMEDIDGTIKESAVKSITREKPVSLKYTLIKDKVEFSNMTGNVEIRIINIAGTQVAHQIVSADMPSINVSDLPAGIYFIQISGNGISQKGLKFVKK